MGKFTKDTIITFIARVLNLVLVLGASIVVARVLGPEGKGIYSLAILLPMLLITFTNPGIGPASVYYIGKKKYLPKEIFGNNIIFSSLVSVFAIIVGLIVIFFFSNSLFPGVEKEYLFLALSLLPFHIFLNFIIDILLGLQKFKKYNLVNLLRTFTFLILIVIFLLGFHFGTKSAIIAQAISFFLAGVPLFFWVKKETNGISFKFNKLYFRDFSLYGGKIYLANILSFLRKRVDMFLVNIFLNPLAVGLYSIAVGLAEKIWLISQSAGLVLFPRVSSETDKKKLKQFTPLVCRNILFITLIGAVLFFFLSDWIITLFYSKAFSDSILPLKILLIGTVAISGSIAMSNDIAGRGKPIINAYIGAVSVIINIILNIIWIPKFGIIGASWATAVSYTVLFIITVFVYSKISGNRIRDVIFIKKSDFRFYKNFLILFKNKYLNYSNHKTK